MIRINRFRGQAPRISPWLLPDNAAQTAINAKCYSGDLRAYLTGRRVYKPSKAGTKLSLYRWGAQPKAEAEGAITAVTNTTPIQISTTTAHGLTTGARVYIDLTGIAAIDGKTHAITVVDPNTFSLDGTNAAGVAATGEWTKQNGFWFHWLTDVDVVRSPIAGDTTERTYFTGDGAPKMTDSSLATTGGGTDYPTNALNLGIPAPAAAITAALVTNGGNIVNATQTNPVQIDTENAHSLQTGDTVYVAGVGGMTQINGREFTVTVIDDNSFTLDGENGTGHGAYTNGGTWEERYAPEDVASRAYVYTYVSSRGEEGPPSPASNIVDAGPGQTVNLTGMSTGPGGAYQITAKRVYRAVTGASGTEFLFVAEVALANTNYTDTKTDDLLGEVIPSADWDPPPADMQGIVVLPNGVVIGFAKNDVCPSVPNQPHAYPVGWRQTTDQPIVAVGAFHQTAAVLTRGHPYLLIGNHPGSMTLLKIENHQSCASKRGVRAFLGGVAYPSPDGLIWIGPGGEWRNLLAGFMTREEWQALKPESIHGYVIDGRYLGFYDNGTTQGAFLYDPDDTHGGIFFFDVYATAGFVDLLSDALYLQIGDYIERWEGGSTRRAYRWRSKVFRQRYKRSFSAVQVIAESYDNLTIRIYCDGKLKHTKRLTGPDPIRLATGFRARDWEFELEGTDHVSEIALGNSFGSFAQQ